MKEEKDMQDVAVDDSDIVINMSNMHRIKFDNVYCDEKKTPTVKGESCPFILRVVYNGRVFPDVLKRMVKDEGVLYFNNHRPILSGEAQLSDEENRIREGNWLALKDKTLKWDYVPKGVQEKKVKAVVLTPEQLVELKFNKDNTPEEQELYDNLYAVREHQLAEDIETMRKGGIRIK